MLDGSDAGQTPDAPAHNAQQQQIMQPDSQDCTGKLPQMLAHLTKYLGLLWQQGMHHARHKSPEEVQELAMQFEGATNASTAHLCRPCKQGLPDNAVLTPFHLAVITANLPVISGCAFGWCLAARHNIEADVCVHLWCGCIAAVGAGAGTAGISCVRLPG